MFDGDGGPDWSDGVAPRAGTGRRTTRVREFGGWCYVAELREHCVAGAGAIALPSNKGITSPGPRKPGTDALLRCPLEREADCIANTVMYGILKLILMSISENASCQRICSESSSSTDS